MNRWKKPLTLILTAAMLLSLLPTVALAAAAELIQEPTAVYAQVYNFDENNTAQVRDMDWKPIAVTVKDGTVSAAASGSTDTLSVFWDETTGKVGFQDGAGKKVIPAGFDNIGLWEVSPEQKAIPVQRGEKWGLIDRTGKSVGGFIYDRMEALYQSDNCFTVWQGEMCGVIDHAGKPVLPMEYNDIFLADELADGTTVYQVARGDKAGVVDGANKVLVPLVYEVYSLGNFAGAPLAMFARDGKYGYVDATGREAIPASYVEAYKFSDGLAIVKNEADGYGYIDEAGREVIPCGFADAYVFSEDGVAVVEDENYNCALIDKTGKLLTGYDYAVILTEEDKGLHLASKASSDGSTYTYGYLDSAGREVIPFRYIDADPFSNGLAVVGTEVGEGAVKYGIIDEKGGVVLPCQYDVVGGAPGDETPLFASDYVWVGSLDEIIYHYKYGVVKIDRSAPSGAAPTAPAAPETVTAVPTSYPVLVDGRQVAFDVYAIRDEKGNDTNYFKLRDLASVLNGTRAQFQVGWDGSVTITTATPYTANGTEMSTPFSGPQTVSDIETATLVNGRAASLDTITLVDGSGNGYTYYKLRDLGGAAGFTVDWDQAAGSIVIRTGG